MVFAVLAVACTALEPVAERVVPLLPWALTRTLLTLPWRWAVTLAALLCLMVVRPVPDTALAGAVLVAGVVLALSAALVEGFAELVEHLRKSPVLTRNLPVPGLSLPPYPRWLLRLRARALTPSHLLLVVPPALAVAGALPHARGHHRAGCLGAARPSPWRWPPPGSSWPPAGTTRAPPCRPPCRRRSPTLAPDLVLYYGGGPDALYQVEMWLPVLEQSRHRTLVVLRDRESLRLMSQTRLPVLCAPAGTVLMSFDLSTVRGALFVANAATNIHLLRKRGMTTAFIGHGDSDKQASSNPFVKVYDELWVAGPAGAERYEGPDTVGRHRAAGRGRPPPGRQRRPPAALRGAGDRALRPDMGGLGRRALPLLAAVRGRRARTPVAGDPRRAAALPPAPPHRHPEHARSGGPTWRSWSCCVPRAPRRPTPSPAAARPTARRRRLAAGRPGPDGGPFGAGAGRPVRGARPAAGGGGLLVLPPDRRCPASSRARGRVWPAASPTPTC